MIKEIILSDQKFQKYFGKNFKFSNFKEEVLDLKKNLKRIKLILIKIQ